MKRSISKILAVTLSLLFVFQTSLVAFAQDSNEPDWEEISLSAQEFEDILALNPTNQIMSRASGLIITYAIAISSSGTNTLIIAGRTYCEPNVVKSGFTVVTLKRRTSSTAAWTTYKTYEDLYRNSPSYSLSRTMTVAEGYQYRVYCTHYAKKSIFSTEKINNVSNVVAIG